jgi:hypothetical protein
MGVPENVVFDRFAVLTDGLVSVLGNLPLLLGTDDVALVTSFIIAGAYGGWSECFDAVTTSWTAIGTNSTGWTPMPTFSTIWTTDPDGV